MSRTVSSSVEQCGIRAACVGGSIPSPSTFDTNTSPVVTKFLVPAYKRKYIAGEVTYVGFLDDPQFVEVI
jgi:hypothetical protein